MATPDLLELYLAYYWQKAITVNQGQVLLLDLGMAIIRQELWIFKEMYQQRRITLSAWSNSNSHSRIQIHGISLIYGNECVNWILWTKNVCLLASFLTVNIIFNLCYSKTQIKKISEPFCSSFCTGSWQKAFCEGQAEEVPDVVPKIFFITFCYPTFLAHI